ncbi:MAG: hypothetical protein WBM28_18210, partial [Burkholderiales bacterium]
MTTLVASPFAASRGAATACAKGWPSTPDAAIKDALVYFDTIHVWVSRNLKQWERDTLDTLCGSFSYRPIWRPTDRWMWLLGYRVKLVLQQPSRDAFEFLRQRLRERPAPMINRVDCAFDFLTSNHAKAERLQLYIDARWYKPYHREKHGVEIFAQATTYLGFKNWKSRYVTYADKPSRHMGGPCCHLECRFQSARVVAALGIDSIKDLLAFDHKAFWEKRLRLYEYDLEELGKRWNGRHLNSAPAIQKFGNFTYNADKRVGETLVRLLAAK